MKKIEIWGTIFEYNNKNIKIHESYLIHDEFLMRTMLKTFKKMTCYNSKRTFESWIKEWKAHNRLYRWGLFRKHTVDCDLEEKEKWYRLIAYQILGI